MSGYMKMAKSKLVCFHCRIGKKSAYDSWGGYGNVDHCPRCRKLMTLVTLGTKIPKQRDLRGWARLKEATDASKP